MKSDIRLPIGVFDSGVGGLTVVRALREELPGESILYFGDTARVPYGVKSADTIRYFASQITRFLVEKQVKMLIVACNTMAAVAIDDIRAQAPVAVLDVIEAGAAAAVGETRTGRIGVIGTLATLDSGAYESALRKLRDGLSIFGRACPLFVPLVEEGWLDHPATRLVANEYLDPLIQSGIDTLVLGCTHYPLLRDLIQDVTGPGVTLVDSARTTASLARKRLSELSLLNTPSDPGTYRFFVTDVPQRFRKIGEQFLDRPLGQIEVVTW